MVLTIEETQEALRQLVRDHEIWAWNSRDCFLRGQIIYSITQNAGSEFPRCKDYTQAEAERFLRNLATFKALVA